MTDSFQLPKFKVGDVVFKDDFDGRRIIEIYSCIKENSTKYEYNIGKHNSVPEYLLYKTREELLSYRINQFFSEYQKSISKQSSEI